MNNNYDPNQQYQYQDPNQQYQYQDPNQQYQQAPVYQQPLYAQPALNPTPFFIMAIVGLALSASFYFSIAGIIVSAIAMSKGKNYFALGGLCEGKAKVAKILSTVGLWVGVGMTVFFVFYIIFVIVMAAIASASGAYYDPYSFY